MTDFDDTAPFIQPNASQIQPNLSPSNQLLQTERTKSPTYTLFFANSFHLDVHHHNMEELTHRYLCYIVTLIQNLLFLKLLVLTHVWLFDLVSNAHTSHSYNPVWMLQYIKQKVANYN